VNLQKKIILVIVPLFMIYGAFGLAIQRLIIMPSFDALERDEATKNMPRAQQALEREIHHLGLASNDWAHWDDTHRFVTGQNSDYVGSNLMFTAFSGLNVNLMLCYGADGKLVWGHAYDLVTEALLSTPELLANEFRNVRRMLAHKSLTSTADGMVMSSLGPMVAASRPILTSNKEGPSAGTLIFGRILTADAVSTIASQARIQLSIQPMNALTSDRHQRTRTRVVGTPNYRYAL
jgi:sensor domain CHASE-containing protein